MDMTQVCKGSSASLAPTAPTIIRHVHSASWWRNYGTARSIRSLSLAFPGHPDPGDGERLRTAIAAASGIILATPEYHGSFCAMTKLIIENLGFPSVLAGKPVALVGVAAGRIGAIKSLEQLKSVCAHIGALVVPGAVSVAGVQSLFDDQGRCTDADVETMLRGVAHALLTFLKDYICPRHILEDMVRSDARPWATTIA